MPRFIRALSVIVMVSTPSASLLAQLGGPEGLVPHTHEALSKPVAPAAPAAPVTVRTQLSQTAVWPGDPFTYTIEITCPPGTDIITEDLARDRLRLVGLDLSGAELDRQARPDGSVVHIARFSLASYSTESAALRIEPIRVRYYIRQAGQRIENMTPAGEVEVPATEISLRSTLPDSAPSGIRDVREPVLLPDFVTFLRPIGLVAIALSFAPVVLGIAAFAARRRASHGKRRARRRPGQHRAALEEIRQLDGATSATRLEAFDRLDKLVREYLSDLDVPARSMSPDEIQTHVAERHPQMPGDVIVAVLRDCQRARYGGPTQLPDVSVLARDLDQTGDLLASRVR